MSISKERWIATGDPRDGTEVYDDEGYEIGEAKCRYIECYQSNPCGADSDDGICDKHKERVCNGCAKQATRECEYTGQFVCGAPLCDNCHGTQGDSTKGMGWGFIGHTHQPKDAKHG